MSQRRIQKTSVNSFKHCWGRKIEVLTNSFLFPFHCISSYLFSLSAVWLWLTLSLCLSHTHTHTYTHTYRFKTSCRETISGADNSQTQANAMCYEQWIEDTHSHTDSPSNCTFGGYQLKESCQKSPVLLHGMTRLLLFIGTCWGTLLGGVGSSLCPKGSFHLSHSLSHLE